MSDLSRDFVSEAVRDLEKIEIKEAYKVKPVGTPCETCPSKACVSPCRRLRRYWREKRK